MGSATIAVSIVDALSAQLAATTGASITADKSTERITMTIKVLLICESPDENKRKMWFAFYNGNIKLEGSKCVQTKWGRIQPGLHMSTRNMIDFAKSTLNVPVENDEKAVKFIDKKVKEKIAKGYVTTEYEHDGLPITFLCDN